MGMKKRNKCFRTTSAATVLINIPSSQCGTGIEISFFILTRIFFFIIYEPCKIYSHITLSYVFRNFYLLKTKVSECPHMVRFRSLSCPQTDTFEQTYTSTRLRECKLLHISKHFFIMKCTSDKIYCSQNIHNLL